MLTKEKRTIILVEDEAIIAVAQAENIKQLGYEVITAFSGEEAVRLATENENISLALMDIDLGRGLSGPDAAQQILARRHIPIVFLTSHSEREMVEKVRGITRYGYVIKNSGDFVLQSSIEMAFELFEANLKIESKMKALQESEQIAALALEGTDQGLWEFDLYQRKITFITNWHNILGYGPEESQFKFKWWLNQIHPESAPVFEKALKDYMEGKSKYLEWVYRIRDKSGEWQWIQALATFNKPDSTGYPSKLVGTHWNITAQRKAKEAEARRDNELRAINEYSMELAYLPYREMFPCIMKKVKELFNIIGALICMYDEASSDLIVQYSTLSDAESSRVMQHLGQKLIGFRVHVNEEFHRTMKTDVAGRFSSLKELTMGAMPELLGKPLEKLFGVEWFSPITLMNKDKIVGTMVLAGGQGQEWPDRQVLLAFAGITANALERKWAEESLRESEARLRVIVENVYDLVYVFDLKGIVTYISPSVRHYGYEADEIIGHHINEFIHKDDISMVAGAFLSSLEKGEEPSFDMRMVRKDGEIVWVWGHSQAIQDEHGKATQYIGILRDYTDRKNTESRMEAAFEALRESETKYRLLADRMIDTLWMMDLDLNLTYISPHAQKRRGYTVEEIAALPLDKQITPASLKLALDIFIEEKSKLMADPNHSVERTLDLEYYRKDGTTFWNENKISLIRDENGNPVSILGEGRDITERKKAEAEREAALESLKESEKRYRLLAENSSDVIWTMDLNGRFTYISPSVKKMTGWSQEEAMSMNLEDYILPEYARWIREVLTAELSKPAAERSQSKIFEIKQYAKDGSVIDDEITATWICDEKGEPAGIQGSNRYITERKLAESKLNASEARYRRLFETAKDGILILDAETGTIIDVNPFLARMLGFSYNDIIGKKVWEMGTFRDIAANRANFLELQKSEYIRYEDMPLETADGRRISVEFISNVYKVNDLRVIQCNIRDIGERKRAENIINVRLSLVEYAASHSMEELLQKALDEVCAITESPIGFYHFLESDQVTLSLQAWSTRTQKEFCTATGKGMHYNINEAGVWVDCVRQRRPVVHNDYASLPHRRGMPEGHAEVTRELVVPIFRDDKIVAILGVGNKQQDYTDKDIELVAYFADVVWEIAKRKGAEELIQNLLREKELLLKEVHHRIKNNMSTMASLLSLQSETFDDPRIVAALEDARSRMVSMGVLYDKLYRSENQEKMSIREYLPPLLDEIIGLFPNSTMVKIEEKIDDFELNVNVLSPLGIIVNELITNSMKHAFTGRKQGKIIVTASLKDKNVNLVVEDDGNGIPESVDPGSTGGFGLQLVDLLMKQMRGSMKIIRKKGTRFVLEFEII